MKYFVCFVFLFCFTALNFSQVDKWNRELQNDAVSNADKSYYADSLLLHYRKTNVDSALYFARQVLVYAKLAGDTGSVDYAHMNLGSLHRHNGNYDSSLFYYSLALDSYKLGGFEEGVASVYNNIATVYTEQGRYDLAIQNYHEALEVFKDSENQNARANIYSNFAGLYFKLENFAKAEEFYLIAREYYLKGKFPYEITNTHRGLARIALEQLEPLRAEEELSNALRIDQENGVSVFVLEDHLLYMKLAILQNEPAKFIVHQAAAFPIISNASDPDQLYTYYELNGDYQRIFKGASDAIAFYDSSLTLINSDHLPQERLRIIKKKFTLKMKYKEYDGLDWMYQEIQDLELRVATIRKDRITQEMAAEFDLKDKEEKILLLDEKNRSAQQLVEKERELQKSNRRQIIFLWIGIAVFLLLAVYVLIINNRIRLTKKELEKNVEQKEFLFRELNHRVKNNLHIVNSFLGIEMHGRSAEIQEILRLCESRIHSLGLMHEMLYQGEITGNVDLKDYLEKLVSFLSRSIVQEETELKLNLQPGVVVSSQKIVLLGLIVNELITNAMKYAKSPERKLHVEVAVAVEGNLVSISVSDNGVGLKEDFNPQKSNTLGMKMAFGLTRQLGGNFAYQNTSPGSRFMISFQNS